MRFSAFKGAARTFSFEDCSKCVIAFSAFILFLRSKLVRAARQFNWTNSLRVLESGIFVSLLSEGAFGVMAL